LLTPQIIPPHLRVLAVNAVNVPWNTFLSLQAAKGKGDEVEVKVGDKVKVDVKKPLSV
jgi:protein Mpv17